MAWVIAAYPCLHWFIRVLSDRSISSQGWADDNLSALVRSPILVTLFSTISPSFVQHTTMSASLIMASQKTHRWWQRHGDSKTEIQGRQRLNILHASVKSLNSSTVECTHTTCENKSSRLIALFGPQPCCFEYLMIVQPSMPWHCYCLAAKPQQLMIQKCCASWVMFCERRPRVFMQQQSNSNQWKSLCSPDVQVQCNSFEDEIQKLNSQLKNPHNLTRVSCFNQVWWECWQCLFWLLNTVPRVGVQVVV